MRRWCSLLLGTSHSFSRRSGRHGLPLVLAIAGASPSCTLITDVDRERIPVPVQPPFMEVDGGGEPLPDLDASAPDGAAPDATALPTSDAGSVPDASAEPSDAGDAAPNGDAG